MEEGEGKAEYGAQKERKGENRKLANKQTNKAGHKPQLHHLQRQQQGSDCHIASSGQN
jgi:hypothetical protein